MAGKLKIVVSDLHLGVSSAGKDNPLEGFTAAAEFAGLLTEIRRESDQQHKDVELILNGDLFAFLQVPAVDRYDPYATYPLQAYQDSSVEASIKRLKIIAQHHPLVFTALTDFLQVKDPTRRATIIKGNHDIHLYWPEVKSKLRQLLGATGAQASLLLFAEEFINRESIYVEHGHQYTERMNIYPNFRLPLDGRDRTQLYYPPGSQFFINYLNQLKGDNWWIDQIKPFTCSIWYALKWDFPLAAKLIAGFVRHTPDSRAKNINANINQSLDYLLQQLEDRAECEILAQNYMASSEGRKMLHQQIQVLTQNARVPDEFHPFTQAEVSPDPLEMARAEQEAVQNSLKNRARELAKDGKAQVFIFGHTHKPAFEKLSEENYYINTGSWLWTQYSGDLTAEIWEQLANSPQGIPFSPHLPYVYIDYDEAGQPHPQLLDYSGQGFGGDLPDGKPFFQKLNSWIRRIFGAD